MSGRRETGICGSGPYVPPMSDRPEEYPRPEALSHTFYVYEVDRGDGEIRYYGEPLTPKASVVDRVAPLFRDRGYRVTLRYETGEHVLVAQKRSVGVDGIPWVNVALFAATILTTLVAGAQWYDIPLTGNPIAIAGAWPFTVAVLGVLGVHEFGHYALSRRHDVQATLPYFIPLPNVLGTLGAVIRMKDHLPSRTALFDIGVAGPLAGLVATVAVTAVGVSLPPIEVGSDALIRQVELGYPPLIQAIAFALGEPLVYEDPSLMVNPVVLGGWVGAFVTFLNLLPVGQLDGAHVARALIGDRLDRLQMAVPAVLFSIAGWHLVVGDSRAITLWIVWGVLALVLSRVGGARPIDQSGVDRTRKAIGVLTLVAGLLCFTPAPIVFAG
ncbi:Membrane-associated protease RseP, regulator of RpoE activity in bacteria [Halapricum desulfuricans]|uniref:Membrane-associated protease RseP, regulator of RpoE activity in bacteria n=2 Tax=Halapricum desulfuricans TaxID=2841257 RepID=A0A897NKR9_9EURY|nr:Membrane-associated protease RseP, regulator of RpoE activity in bacteria [Halapricum desulfuricans]